ncbi:LysR family transcriptional regulator [Viridibacillus sp. YIM B01967]|uniref:LysR family transcriptional regulator n=1 Tax=Viridibacillus soli TaxID=2798301 RepID=A0ABS1H469_9BACL|nr:LysR family transcriptional regulator [Viridibacillus soli]MBK3494213.1 LysR family transcriptional regulator [Viridibacillus soli]
MDIKHLHTFLTAAKTLSFTQTAEILDYAQSSITAQIKSLEGELGIPLFERLGKRIYLTEDGKQIEQYAQKMVDLEETMRKALSNQDESNVTLTIGAQESQCTYRLPKILQLFKNRHPRVKIVFKPVHTIEVAKDLLQSGNLDLAFITDTHKETPMLCKEELIEENLVFVVAPTHHLTHNKTLTLQNVAKETILLTEEGCSYRNQFEYQCHSEGIHPKQIIEFSSIEAIKQCVIAGLGITLLPKMTVEKELEKGLLIELQTTIIMETVFTELAWHKDKYIFSYLEDFIQISCEQYKLFNGYYSV